MPPVTAPGEDRKNPWWDTQGINAGVHYVFSAGDIAIRARFLAEKADTAADPHHWAWLAPAVGLG